MKIIRWIEKFLIVIGIYGAVFLSALRSLSQSAENPRFLANVICTQRSYSPFSELSSTGGISDERRLLSLLRSRRFVLDR